MNGENLLKIISLAVASISFAISVMLWGEISGFEQGMLAAYNIEDVNNMIKFATHGPNFFEFVIGKYSLIALCFYIYLVGKLIKTEQLSHIFCFLSLGIIVILYWQLFQFKYDIDDSAVLLYRKWLTKSIKFDWFCFSSALILLIVQGTILFVYYFGKNNKTT